MTIRPITEEDLHAYVDLALDEARKAEVEAYLERHPETARQVEGFRRQRNELREIFAPIAEEPTPPEHNLARMIAERRRPALGPWRGAAAAALLLCVGAAGGWSMRAGLEPPTEGVAALAREAQDSYAVFAPDPTRPVEIAGDNRAELVAWVSQRLGRRVAPPDLSASGYRLLGGRLAPTPHGPAALFVYEDADGVRLALLTRQMAVDRDAPMSPHARDGVAGFTWARDGLGFSLVGPASPEILHPLADEARRQIERTT